MMDQLQADLEQYRGRDGFIHLKRKYSTLFEKTNYTTELPFIINRITEYDLKAANISAMEASGKFDPKVIARLRDMPKEQREITVGLMEREDRSITKIKKRGIQHAREMLFDANKLQDIEIVSIKNDAVFVAGRRLKYTDFGSYHFIPKNVYSLFMQLDKRLEFYYDGKHKRVDVKGLGKDVPEDPDHQNGMLKFFQNVFQYLVQDRRAQLKQYLIEFVEAYKAKELPICYYKEMNSYSIYRSNLIIGTDSYYMTEASEEDLESINGIYNFTRYILPIVQTFL